MKRYTAYDLVSGLIKSEDLYEAHTLGLNKQAKQKFDKVDAVDNVLQIQFKDPEVERICHEHGVYTISDANKVTSIEHWFERNEKIKSFNEFKYFTGLKKLENSAFIRCYKLKEIILPNKITTIEIYVFSWCKSLYNLTLPNSVTTIENEAFSWFESLRRINIPNSVTTIGDYAFEKCKSLYSINIPDSVTSIGSGAFGWCPRLSVVYISNNHPLKKQLQKSYKKYSFYDPNEVKESFTSNVINNAK